MENITSSIIIFTGMVMLAGTIYSITECLKRIMNHLDRIAKALEKSNETKS